MINVLCFRVLGLLHETRKRDGRCPETKGAQQLRNLLVKCVDLEVEAVQPWTLGRRGRMDLWRYPELPTDPCLPSTNSDRLIGAYHLRQHLCQSLIPRILREMCQTPEDYRARGCAKSRFHRCARQYERPQPEGDHREVLTKETQFQPHQDPCGFIKGHRSITHPYFLSR